MKLATIRTAAGTAAVRIDDGGAAPGAVELGAADPGAFLDPDRRAVAAGADGPRA